MIATSTLINKYVYLKLSSIEENDRASRVGPLLKLSQVSSKQYTQQFMARNRFIHTVGHDGCAHDSL
jgi:hypothetical protein